MHVEIKRVKYTKSPPLFFIELRKRINRYFTDNNYSRLANRKMHIKTTILLLIWFSFYCLLISNIFRSYDLLAMQIGFHWMSFVVWNCSMILALYANDDNLVRAILLFTHRHIDLIEPVTGSVNFPGVIKHGPSKRNMWKMVVSEAERNRIFKNNFIPVNVDIKNSLTTFVSRSPSFLLSNQE